MTSPDVPNRSQPRPLSAVAVIPARFGSTRLPGKPLLSETGKPLIQHVVEAARSARRLQEVIVATDDLRIAETVRSFGSQAVLTRPDHPSGTDRVAEVAAGLPGVDIVVNVQGDEPEVAGETIDRLIASLESQPEASMATVCTPIHSETDFRDPGCVKVVLSASGQALYFSRSPIPHHRDGLPDGVLGHLHLGLYAYRRTFLLDLANRPPSPLEQAEKLEQLRVLEAGERIACVVVEERSIGIDTPEDYRRFVERWRAAHPAGRVA